MKESDSILPVTPKLNLGRELIVARPEVSRILSQSLELHKAFQAANVLESLGLDRMMEEWRHTAREIVALPALAVAENSRLFDGLRSAMAEANSLLAQQMESYRLAASTVQAASQQWAYDFASASTLMADVAKINFALPEQALLHWSEKLVAVRAPLLDDCIRNIQARREIGRAKQRLNRTSLLLKHFRQSVLAAACSGKLTEEWRMQNPSLESGSELVTTIRSKLGRALDDDFGVAMAALDLPDIPDSWTWAPTAHVGLIKGGIQKQPKRAPKKNAYPYLRVANVLRDRLDLAEIHKMELFGSELESYRLKAGDLLVVEGNGSLSEIGRSALWNGAIDDCVHQNHIIRVRLVDCMPEFVNAYWNSPLGIDSIAQVAVTTAGLYSLSTKKIGRIPVPIPPREEQQEIVRRVEALFKLADAVEKRVAAATLRAERLTQAILAKAFRGELVSTEAERARREGRGYEPAAVLLERIKNERAATEQKTKRSPGRRRTGHASLSPS